MTFPGRSGLTDFDRVMTGLTSELFASHSIYSTYISFAHGFDQ